MAKVVGIRFKSAGKIYYFDPGDLDLQPGQDVIVETTRGLEYGEVVVGIREVEEEEIVSPLKPVVGWRPGKIKTSGSKQKKEKEAFQICLDKIAPTNCP